MARPKFRRKPDWRYLCRTPRGYTMLIMFVVCIVGIKLTNDLYDDVFGSKEINLVSTVDKEISVVTEAVVTMNFVTELLPGEDFGSETPSTNTEDIFLSTPASVEISKEKSSESSEEAEEDGEELLTPSANGSLDGQSSSAFHSVIPIKDDLRMVHQKRLLWCIHCSFFAYNYTIVAVHIFVKMFLKTKDDIYKMTTVMTLMINWMLTFLAVMSIKGTGDLIMPFLLELLLTFIVTLIKCKIYPEISIVTEDPVEVQVNEAIGDVSPPEQMLLEEYVDRLNSTGGFAEADDANLSNAEEGHADAARSNSDNEEASFLEARVDVGDVGLQYHDENEGRSTSKEPDSSLRSSKDE